MQKQLADTDSIYCANVTNSHQSSVFIAATDSIEACSVFGDNYESNMDVVIVLSKDNLRLNLLSHFLKDTTYYKRGSNTKWTLDKKWLLDRDAAVDKVFRAKYGKFHASVNKEVSRTYLKGITALKSDEHGNKLDLREYLFSGDIIELVRQKDGSIFLTVQGCGGEFKFESVNLLKEFEDWLTNVHKKADGKPLGATAIGSYIRALDVSTKQNPDGSPASNHGKVVWHNIYQHLHGSPAPKGVFQIDNFAEFDTMFGPLKLAVNKGDAPPNVVSQHFTEIQQWIVGQTGGAFLPPALDLYGKFLQWRESEQTKKNEPKVAAADVLTVALKMFAEKRAVDKPSAWGSYDAWSHGVRTDFAAVDESLLADHDFDYIAFMRKFAISWQVTNTNFASHSDAERREVLKFLKEQKDSPKSASWYIDEANRLIVGGSLVDGMSPKTVLYFMSELHPAEFAVWTEPMYDGLAFLGLHKGAVPKLTVETYEDCKAKQQQIIVRMKELGIGKATDDPSDPDYRTVNEFLWWLGQDDNKNLIKEEVMSKAMKTNAPTKYDETKRNKLSFKPGSKDDELLLRLLAALRAKPFAILAGHSGTGKSRYVKKLAYMTCNVDELRVEGQLPGNYLLLQVKPNWHDSTELLGFRNAMDRNRYQKTQLIEFLFKAYHFKETPFFLCLDEMNLAPVEQYFAEFLSAMESKEPVPLNDITENDDNLLELGCDWVDSLEFLKANKFSIPKNLFIVGTVNMDETTNQFSRKVLDRAFTIEMTDVDFKSFNVVEEPSYKDTVEESHIEALLNGEKSVAALDVADTDGSSALVKVQKALEPTAFAIAYRFANEYTLLKRAIECFDPGKAINLDALDQAVLMKILPRIAGEKDYIKKVYGESEDKGLRAALKGKTMSLKKIADILKRADDMNLMYVTFWP